MISFVGLNQFMTQRGYTFFIICLYVMVVGLAMNVLLCLYVANSFKNNRFDHVSAKGQGQLALWMGRHLNLA